jgi:hypothetical protein
MYEPEKIATIEVADSSTDDRRRRNYRIERSLFTVAALLVAALVVYGVVLSLEFKGLWGLVEVPFALVTLCILLRMAVLGR